MPIFHDLSILFVHIPKNAGRSIEAALLQEEGTPDSGRRSLLNRAAKAVEKSTASNFAKKYLIGTLDVSLVAQHMTYCEMELLGLLPPKIDTCFALCRNPYDRAISSLFHFTENSKHPKTPAEFEQALEKWLKSEITDHNIRAHRRPQYDYVTDKCGDVAVPHILRYENLSADFLALMQQIGHPEIELPWYGKSKRNTRNYHDFFSQISRELVETYFGEDLDKFSYKF